MKLRLTSLIFFFLTLLVGLVLPKSVSADWPVAGDVTQIDNYTVQIDNIGSGWTGCNDFWYAQLYGATDNYTYPIAGGTLGNSLTGSSCETISNTSIKITFEWPFWIFIYRPGHIRFFMPR